MSSKVNESIVYIKNKMSNRNTKQSYICSADKNAVRSLQEANAVFSLGVMFWYSLTEHSQQLYSEHNYHGVMHFLHI